MFIEANDDGDGGDNWTTGAISHAKLQSNHHHQQTNIQFFYRPDALPVAQPTVSKHWREKYHIRWTCLPQAHLGVFQLCLLTTYSSWLFWGRVAMPLISPLMPVPQENVMIRGVCCILHWIPLVNKYLFENMTLIRVNVRLIWCRVGAKLFYLSTCRVQSCFTCTRVGQLFYLSTCRVHRCFTCPRVGQLFYLSMCRVHRCFTCPRVGCKAVLPVHV